MMTCQAYKALLLMVCLLLMSIAGGTVMAAKDVKESPQAGQAAVEGSPRGLAPPARHSSSSTTGERINWQVISSGGTDATSAHYIMMGTLGQTGIDFGSSTNFRLSHGYWQAYGGCCNGDGMRGNVDDVAGTGGEVDVADLTYLVSYLFQGGAEPPCRDEANVDGIEGTGGPVDVADLTYLVSYLFLGGAEPAACP